jgi:hypothetical protein
MPNPRYEIWSYCKTKAQDALSFVFATSAPEDAEEYRKNGQRVDSVRDAGNYTIILKLESGSIEPEIYKLKPKG